MISSLFINRTMYAFFHIRTVIIPQPISITHSLVCVGQYEKGHVLIYLSHILPGQITCYCPRKMLLPRRQITCRKLCFYYTCKFGIISIKYVISNVIIMCYRRANPMCDATIRNQYILKPLWDLDNMKSWLGNTLMPIIIIKYKNFHR
jgi:hypothetical protein